MIMKPLLAIALAGASLAAQAQTIPNSGRILQQVAPPENVAPRATPDLAVERADQPPAADTPPFFVHRILVEGNTAFDSATLHALVAAGEGNTLTLAQLDALAARITDYYHDHDYPLARAIVPAQVLDAGTVRIAVVEARYDQIRLDNRSRVNDRLLRATLAPLQSGQPVAQYALDRSLLLLADIPGVIPHATLSPGNAVGTSTLSVQTDPADPGPVLAGTITVDNAGNAYTGRARVGVWLDIRNPLRHGDLITVGAISSGRGLAYARLAYQAIVNGRGTQLGAAYSILNYDLGGKLDALEAHGTAAVASAWASHPLIRSRHGNLDVRVQFEHKLLRDRIDVVALRGDRHTASGTIGLDGDFRDASGINSASVSITHGRLGFDDAAAAATDAATARAAGTYTRVNAQFERMQALTARMHLSLGVQAQWSNDNLDSSEQFLLGGPQGARAYDVGVLAGVSGYAATMALRHEIPLSRHSRTEVSLFVDTGSLRINAHPWVAGANHARVHSAGLSLDWAGRHRWMARAQLAIPLGSTPVLVGERHRARLWLQLAKGF